MRKLQSVDASLPFGAQFWAVYNKVFPPLWPVHFSKTVFKCESYLLSAGRRLGPRRWGRPPVQAAQGCGTSGAKPGARHERRLMGPEQPSSMLSIYMLFCQHKYK